MTTKSAISLVSTLALAVGLSGCATTDIKKAVDATVAGGKAVGGAASAAWTAGREALTKPADATPAPAAATTKAEAKPEVKKADITWDNKFADRFSGQNRLTKTLGSVVWVSPHNEFIAFSVAPKDPKSQAKPIVAYGQISAEACNRKASDLGSQALSAGGRVLSGALGNAANASGVGAQVLRQSGVVPAKPTTAATTPASISTVTGAYAGLTEPQKADCIGAVGIVKGLVDTKIGEATKDFSQKNKDVPYIVTIAGTKGADIVLGLTVNAPAAPASPAPRR